jgi:hypothetical protein
VCVCVGGGGVTVMPLNPESWLKWSSLEEQATLDTVSAGSCSLQLYLRPVQLEG